MPVQEGPYTEIGAFDAKTKLSEILRRVEQGERFTITRNGRAVADVVPASQNSVAWGRRQVTPEQREAVLKLLRNPKIEGVSHEQIRAWIEEGRE